MRSKSHPLSLEPENAALTSKQHLPALDGVRGLAILLVLAHHLLAANDAITRSLFLNVTLAVRSAGWMGVDLFFVLSGFLITGILYDSLGGPEYFRPFYARRFLRIFPLYYGVLFLLLIFTYPLQIHWNGFQYVLFVYLQNIPPLSYLGAGHVSAYTGHFWSLAVEEQFYLVWPLAIFLLRTRRRIIAAALLVAAIAPALRTFFLLSGFGHWLIYTFTLCRMDSLLIGAALSVAMRGPVRKLLLRWAPISLCIFLGGTLLISFFLHSWDLSEETNGFLDSVGYSLLAIGFAALIATVQRPHSFLNAVFRIRVLRWFGKYSYGIYVLHLIIFGMIGLGPRHWLDDRFHSKALGVVLGAVPALLITLALAWLSYNFYESRFLRLKKYFEYQGQRPTSVAG